MLPSNLLELLFEAPLKFKSNIEVNNLVSVLLSKRYFFPKPNVNVWS